jgi:hypothetical protein
MAFGSLADTMADRYGREESEGGEFITVTS